MEPGQRQRVRVLGVEGDLDDLRGWSGGGGGRRRRRGRDLDDDRGGGATATTEPAGDSRGERKRRHRRDELHRLASAPGFLRLARVRFLGDGGGGGGR